MEIFYRIELEARLPNGTKMAGNLIHPKPHRLKIIRLAKFGSTTSAAKRKEEPFQKAIFSNLKKLRWLKKNTFFPYGFFSKTWFRFFRELLFCQRRKSKSFRVKTDLKMFQFSVFFRKFFFHPKSKSEKVSFIFSLCCQEFHFSRRDGWLAFRNK